MLTNEEYCSKMYTKMSDDNFALLINEFKNEKKKI